MRIELKSFEPDAFWKQFSMNCRLESENGILSVQFEVVGLVGDLLLAEKCPTPKFRDNLWKETCFEVFCAQYRSEVYREFNLSTSGDWAVYDFKSYRLPLQSPAQKALPERLDLEVLKTERKVIFSASLEGAALPQGSKSWADLDLGVAAVLELKNGLVSHWAPTHSKGKPDFHLRSNMRFRVQA